MAAATGGRIGGVPGTVARYLRYALSVAAGNAANLLTLARLFCAVPIVLLVRAGAFHQAALLFLIAALSDALDGYVAKRFNGVTPLGAVLDPVADKVLMDSLFLTLAFEGHLPAWVSMLVIGRDILIVGGTLFLRMVAGRFRVEPLLLGKASTFLQIALGGAVLAQLSVLPGLEPWLQPLVIVTSLVVIASAVAYVLAAGRIWSLARVAR
jgi:cardiolipin synthase (CMP-forming)